MNIKSTQLCFQSEVLGRDIPMADILRLPFDELRMIQLETEEMISELGRQIHQVESGAIDDYDKNWFHRLQTKYRICKRVQKIAGRAASDRCAMEKTQREGAAAEARLELARQQCAVALAKVELARQKLQQEGDGARQWMDVHLQALDRQELLRQAQYDRFNDLVRDELGDERWRAIWKMANTLADEQFESLEQDEPAVAA